MSTFTQGSNHILHLFMGKAGEGRQNFAELMPHVRWFSMTYLVIYMSIFFSSQVGFLCPSLKLAVALSPELVTRLEYFLLNSVHQSS